MLSSLFPRILEMEQGLDGTTDPASVFVCLGIRMERPIQRLQKPELIE